MEQFVGDTGSFGVLVDTGFCSLVERTAIGGVCLTTKVRQSLFYTQNHKIQAAFAPIDINFG